MKSTKKLVLSAVLSALGTVILLLGGVLNIFDLCAAALASMLMAFAYIEIGPPYTWCIWIVTTLTSALILPGNLIWVEYLVAFGCYPIIKGYIERTKRWLWIPLKLLFANISFLMVVLASSFVMGVPYFDGELLIINILIYVLTIVTFVVYDMCITACVRFYFAKLRPVFKKILK